MGIKKTCQRTWGKERVGSAITSRVRGQVVKLDIQEFYLCKMQANINMLRDTIDEILGYFGKVYGCLSEETYFEMKVVLNELLVNAIKHGSKEDGEKTIRVIAGLAHDEYAFLSIEDEGDGYDTALSGQRKDKGVLGSESSNGSGDTGGASKSGDIGDADESGDTESTDESGDTVGSGESGCSDDDLLKMCDFDNESGRGIFIVKSLCDDFMVNQKGNRVIVNKKLKRA